jgi:hypothetical protein
MYNGTIDTVTSAHCRERTGQAEAAAGGVAAAQW